MQEFESSLKREGTIRDQEFENVQRSEILPDPRPNFFIVGAAKAGTTSMHAYLAEHPQVFMSDLKEPHFFSDFCVAPQFDNFMPIVRDPNEYQRLFQASAGFKAIGEASPSYLCDDEAAQRIKAAVPDARIIISLRDPVQRAYSQYLMEYFEGNETLPFGEALAADQDRPEKGWGVSFQYIELGLYASQVERYLKTFGSDAVMVVLFEEFVRDTEKVMHEIAGFLGVDPSLFPEGVFESAHNPYEETRGQFARAVLRSRPIRLFAKKRLPLWLRSFVRNRILFRNGVKPQMDPDLARKLRETFAADIERLEKVLGRKLPVLWGDD